MRKLNIVLAATGISSKACDLYLTQVSQRLRKKGHRVWLIRVNPKKVNKDALPVYWSGPRWQPLWLLYLFCPFFQDRVISGLVNQAVRKVKEPVDIVNFEIPSLAYCYQRRDREKVIVRGWFYPHQFLPRLKIIFPVGPQNLINKFFFIIRQIWFYLGDEYGFRKSNIIITLTEKLASQLNKRGFKATWIPLGIEVKKHQKGEAKKPIKFGTIAFDLENPRKGIRFLLSAIKLLDKLNLPKDSYQVELVGGYTQTLVDKIKTLGIRKKIILSGRLNHQQVLKKLQGWDVFVFPSLFEELSLATIEAMAAGLVCLGWKIDALEAAWGKAAILLPKSNAQKLAETIAKLISSPKLRAKLSQKARKRAEKYFAWEVVINKLLLTADSPFDTG